MAMDKDVLGTAIAATIKTFRQSDGTQVTDLILENMWKAVADDIIEHIRSEMDIVLAEGDITTNLTTGDNNAVTLSGKAN